MNGGTRRIGFFIIIRRCSAKEWSGAASAVIFRKENQDFRVVFCNYADILFLNKGKEVLHGQSVLF